MADANDGRVTLPDDVESAIEAYGDAVRRTCGDSGPEDYAALENASDALRRVLARPRAADDARPMVTGGGLIKFDRRADDASGAEAAACVAPAHDMAPRVVVEPYGRSEWRVWLHIGSASWAVGDPRHTKDAAERFAEPLRHALRAPLPATDDAVEEAAEELCDYLDKTSGGEEWKGSSLVRRLRAALRRAKGGHRG